MSTTEVLFPSIVGEWQIDSRTDAAEAIWGMLCTLANQPQPDAWRAGEGLRVHVSDLKQRDGWWWQFEVRGAGSGRQYGTLATVPSGGRDFPPIARERLAAVLEGLLNGTGAASVRSCPDLATLLGLGLPAAADPRAGSEGRSAAELHPRLTGLLGLLVLGGFSVLVIALLQSLTR